MPIRPGRSRCCALLLMTAVVLAALAACSSSAPPSVAALPSTFHGQWYYTGSSGGISGEGLGDDATGYIVIRADNTMTMHDEDGTLVRTVPFTVSRGKTIFSTDDQWIVRRDGGEPEVIVVAEDGRTMSLSENVYDGFSRSYARAR